MSHAVLRGEPTQAQIHLDGILESIIITKRDADINNIGLSEVLLHCLKVNRSGIFMINGLTDEYITNEDILKKSIRLARALINKGFKGKTVMLLLRNNQYMAAVYCGVIFSGAIPIMIDPNIKVSKIIFFTSLSCPTIIFCENRRVEDVTTAVNSYNGDKPLVVVADTDEMDQFTAGSSDNIDSFRIKHVNNDLPVLMLPTSGSTGLPKAAKLTNGGLVAQLPSLWAHHTQFPRPTNLAMLVSTAHWMTHSILMTTCPVYQITLLMTPTPTIDCILTMIRRHKPTWALLGPEFANDLATTASSDDLSSFRTVLTAGSKPGPDIMKTLKSKLSKNVNLCNGYGTTETQGFISVPGLRTPFESNGRISNIFKFKLVDETGKEVGVNESGELYLHSDLCILQGYANNEEAFEECITSDGWLKTGDFFYQNSDSLIFFVERRKFWFKYQNYNISPEELEALIGDIAGVKECVVCETAKGPAAGVVKQPNCNITEKDIDYVVSSALCDYKRLRGGVAFVASLPRTPSGKLDRTDCREFINEVLGRK